MFVSNEVFNNFVDRSTSKMSIVDLYMLSNMPTDTFKVHFIVKSTTRIPKTLDFFEWWSWRNKLAAIFFSLIESWLQILFLLITTRFSPHDTDELNQESSISTRIDFFILIFSRFAEALRMRWVEFNFLNSHPSHQSAKWATSKAWNSKLNEMFTDLASFHLFSVYTLKF